MGQCTWDPTSRVDKCKCHYCKDRRGSKKKLPLLLVPELILLATLMKKAVSGSNSGPKITSWLFKSLICAYWLTVISCCVSTAYLQSPQDKNILCTSVGMNLDELFIAQRYCLMASTYTLGNFTVTGESQIHPGIPSSISSEHEQVRHVYYQWVPYVLLLQCVMLYLPWHSLSMSGKDEVFKALVGNLDKIELSRPKPKDDKEEPDAKNGKDATSADGVLERRTKRGKKKRSNFYTIAECYEQECKEQAEIFKRSIGNHGDFFRKFLFAEVFGCAVAVGNLFLTNLFLGNEFFGYGKEMIRHLWKKDIDPMDPFSIMNQVFPKIAKCTWRTIGSSGEIQNKGLLCVLPLNVVFEKIYMVLWVAYIAIVVITTLTLLYHFYLFVVPKVLDQRILNHHNNLTPGADEYRINTRLVLKYCSVADKFMLWNLCGHTRNFSAYIKELATKLGSKVSDVDSKPDLQPNAPLAETEL